ncbi:family finger-like domain protein [Ruegeria denitrificans]|uniref:Family finger-like domain protein n=1 Tax=Ruegeria denitrificans TaxID=1715692 RepID=A0A0P1IA13_9RHOB|nr:zinc-ribbon domain-containing protein [Ruegeria denitrificans]CUK00773.1 family finger-like domain protein [Ruegeria denitrificans]
MRLTCPNCSAQYEVPDEVIPEEGRDVQCSSCENTWFQDKYPDRPAPTPAAEEQPDQEKASEPAPTPVDEAFAADVNVESSPEPAPEPEKPAATGNVDPAVASILKEEAAREADLRAREGGSLETQPDLALDTPPEPDPEHAVKELTATETAEDAGQKDALPDVEAINSSLRSDDIMGVDEEPAPRKSGGFARGFALILIVGIILLLVYSNAQKISEAVPQAEPILDPYVSMVDQARLWLEAQTSGTAQN